MMTDETNQLIQLELQILKQIMKDSGVILALAVDHSDADKSKICFIDKEKYLKKQKASGISVSLTDFNKDLI